MSKARHVVAAALAFAFVLPLAAFHAGRNPNAGPSATALLAAMNRERIADGLRPLRFNEKLTEAAEDRVNDMFAKHYFSHVSPDGIDPFTWADVRGYRYTAIGENLAVGYRTADDVVDGWMSSPGHRENILKKEFDEIGIATAGASPDHKHAGPLVVVLYGAR
jgi:uncharacterized protein YkwD